MKISQKLDLFTDFGTFECVDEGLNLLNYKFEPNLSFTEIEVSIQSPKYGGHCFFGAFSYMNNGGYIRSNVFVGRFCSIGRRVSLAAGGHDYNGISTHPKLMRKDQDSKLTILENDIWIGDGVVVLPGVRVGQGAVIGANAVVTKNIPPYSIAVGQPAKVIKKRFSDIKIELLVKSDLFDMSLSSIKEIDKLLELSDELFLEKFCELQDSSEVYDTFLLN